MHNYTLVHREQEIAFVEQAYAQVEAVNFELEQYKQETRELQNQVALANEEQEALATQLYETGHALDEATAEVCVSGDGRFFFGSCFHGNGLFFCCLPYLCAVASTNVTTFSKCKELFFI